MFSGTGCCSNKPGLNLLGNLISDYSRRASSRGGGGHVGRFPLVLLLVLVLVLLVNLTLGNRSIEEEE